MKKKTLTFILMTLLTFVGAKAEDFSKSSLVNDGWTLISEIPATPTDYFFVIADASQELFVSEEDVTGKSTLGIGLWYRTAANPATNLSMIFSIETNGEKYALRGTTEPKYQLNVHYKRVWDYSTQDILFSSEENGWSQIAFESTETSNVFRIKTTQGSYLGNRNASSAPVADEWMASDRSTDQAGCGTFMIYSIPRSEYLTKYVAANEKPLDVSFMMLGKTFAYTGSGTSKSPVNWSPSSSLKMNNWTGADSDAGLTNPWIEAWVASSNNLSDGTYEYSMANMPSGYYQVSMLVRAIKEGGTLDDVEGVKAFANTTEIAVNNTNGNHITAGAYGTFAMTTNVTDGNLAFGTKTASTNCSWVAWNTVVVTYYGDLSAFKTVLEGKMATAKAITGLPTAAATALNTAIANNTGTNENCEYLSVDDYNTHTDALQAAIDLANDILAAYNTYTSTKTKVNAIKEQNVYTDPGTVVSTYNSSLNTLDSNVQNATDVATITTQTNGLISVLATLMSSVTINDGQYFDLTSLITNPSFDSDASGWSGTVPGVNYSAAEFYNRTFDMYQVLANMPAGIFKLNVKAFQRVAAAGNIADYGQSDVKTYIYFTSGETTAQTAVKYIAQSTTQYNTLNEVTVEINGVTYYCPNNMAGAATFFSNGWYENEVMVQTDASGDLRLGFKNNNYVQYGWTIFDDFRLYYYGNTVSMTLDESTGYTAANDIEHVNVTVNRAMTANVWNTLVVPFDMTIPSDWTVMEPTGLSEGTLTFSNASSIVAGKPYVVKPTSDVTSISATNVTLKKDLVDTEVNDLTMKGTYTNIDAIDYTSQNSYVVGVVGTESALYKVNSTVSLKPFRAYFTLPLSSLAPARFNLNFDDATAIDGIVTRNGEEGQWFDLMGRRVATPTKGLYIVNGKKVLVK